MVLFVLFYTISCDKSINIISLITSTCYFNPTDAAPSLHHQLNKLIVVVLVFEVL